MSGIAAVLNLDGRPVGQEEISAMIEPMLERGPDHTGTWRDGEVGLGHTLLVTTPEGAGDQQPLARGRWTITADARIDNRDELLKDLRTRRAGADIGDAELILLGYERWGEHVVHHLLGDFAFAIWDADDHRLFCARDHMGVRPLYVHHAPHRRVAVASTPYAILALPGMPRGLNEGRIADFLQGPLEGIDKTSTFFEGISRLPPAHSLSIAGHDAREARFWKLEAEPELVLGSDEEYDESFLEVFAEAVRCRLRGGKTTGSMLSGGLDSSAIVAVARTMSAELGGAPLATFSATSGLSERCVETEAINHAVTMAGIAPSIVSPHDWQGILPALQAALWRLDEPFDWNMNLQRSLYLTARQEGTLAVLDGIDADTVFGEGSELARLLRRGHLREAIGLARSLETFWSDQFSHAVASQLIAAARTDLLPSPVRSLGRSVLRRGSKLPVQVLERSMISPDLADRVRLVERMQLLAELDQPSSKLSPGEEAAAAISHPYLTVGVERYGRVASAFGLEPRHPFLDRRLLAWSTSLPVAQKLAGGWPKGIVRRAMAGRLPDEVRWRRGKEHLGANYSELLLRSVSDEARRLIEDSRELLEPFVRWESIQRSLEPTDSPVMMVEFVEVAVLAGWLTSIDLNMREGTA